MKTLRLAALFILANTVTVAWSTSVPVTVDFDHPLSGTPSYMTVYDKHTGPVVLRTTRAGDDNWKTGSTKKITAVCRQLYIHNAPGRSVTKGIISCSH